jgi:hypothetical protein
MLRRKFILSPVICHLPFSSLLSFDFPGAPGHIPKGRLATSPSRTFRGFDGLDTPGCSTYETSDACFKWSQAMCSPFTFEAQFLQPRGIYTPRPDRRENDRKGRLTLIVIPAETNWHFA